MVNNHGKSAHDKPFFFSPGEIWHTIRKLTNRNAPDLTQFWTVRLSTVIKIASCSLCKILNGCIRLLYYTKYFTSCWKIASVVMLLKPGKDILPPKNHRPVSLLNTLAKTFERILLTRLNRYISPKIRSEQFGFRQKYSTTLQLINVFDDIILNIDKWLKTAAVLIDFEKALGLTCRSHLQTNRHRSSLSVNQRH